MSEIISTGIGRPTLRDGWGIELLLERLNHGHGKCLALLPDINEFLNLVLLAWVRSMHLQIIDDTYCKPPLV